MTKTFWFLFDQEGYVYDCLSFELEGYTALEVQYPLPQNVLGGCYKIDKDNNFVFDTEKNEKKMEEQRRYDKNEFDALKEEVETLKAAIEELKSANTAE